MPVIERVQAISVKPITFKNSELKHSQDNADRLWRQRTLRVSEVAFPRRKQDATHLGDPMQPSIHLKGNWLMKAGFQAGQEVKVEISSKQLIIHIPE